MMVKVKPLKFSEDQLRTVFALCSLLIALLTITSSAPAQDADLFIV
jgi:hypothetical protein